MEFPEQPDARPFGAAEDLDLEFAGADRPTLTTALLARCAGGGADRWWAQPVGARNAALLRLYARDSGSDRVELGARCVHAGCDETFAFELPLGALAAHPPMPATVTVILAGGRRVTLRQPIGRDLARWRLARPATRAQAVRLMLHDLIVEGTPASDEELTPDEESAPDEELAVAEAIATRDPLVALTVAADCPACGHAQDVAVDVEGLALRYFGGRQQAILRDVHRLARSYGWSERQIMAVPAARRASYLALIDGDVA